MKKLIAALFLLLPCGSFLPCGSATAAVPGDAMTQLLATMSPNTWKSTGVTLYSTCYETVTTATDYNATVSRNNFGTSGCYSDLGGAEHGIVYDSVRNRLIIGQNGGHQEYYGNELYIFDLASLTIRRVTSPDDAGTLAFQDNTVNNQAYPTIDPVANHSYGGNSFIPTLGSAGTVIDWGQGAGNGGGAGCSSTLTGWQPWMSCSDIFFWDANYEDKGLFNPPHLGAGDIGRDAPLLSGSGWYRVKPNPPPGGAIAGGMNVGEETGYDPVSNSVIKTWNFTGSQTNGNWITKFNPTIRPLANAWSFLPATGSDADLGGGATPNYWSNSAVWGRHQIMWSIGRPGNHPGDTGLTKINMVTGASNKIQYVGYVRGVENPCIWYVPGMAYHPPSDKIIVWPSGGNTICIFDPAALTFTPKVTGGLTLPTQNATLYANYSNAFVYDPIHNCFVLIVATHSPIYVYKPDF